MASVGLRRSTRSAAACARRTWRRAAPSRRRRAGTKASAARSIMSSTRRRRCGRPHCCRRQVGRRSRASAARCLPPRTRRTTCPSPPISRGWPTHPPRRRAPPRCRRPSRRDRRDGRDGERRRRHCCEGGATYVPCTLIVTTRTLPPAGTGSATTRSATSATGWCAASASHRLGRRRVQPARLVRRERSEEQRAAGDRPAARDLTEAEVDEERAGDDFEQRDSATSPPVMYRGA